MQTTIRYTETLKQVLGIILVPIIYVGIMMAILFSFNLEQLSEGAEFAVIMAAVILMFSASIFTIFRVIMEKGVAIYDKQGLHIRLNRGTFLYPHKDFIIPFGNIADAAINAEPGKSNFINLTLKVPSKSLMIFPEGYIDSAEFDDFWEGLNREIEQFNHTLPAESPDIIKGKGFYDSKWVKGVAWASLVATAGLSFLKIGNPEAVSGWKLFMLYCYVVPLCFAVFRPK